MSKTPSFDLRSATLLAAAAMATSAGASTLDDMVRFDATYIPALAASSSAVQNPGAATQAMASLQRLETRWPDLRHRLAGTWPGATPAGWPQVLLSIDSRIGHALAAGRRADWKGAHEALEEVRIDLMRARQRQGMDYFVDRLTTYHEPMEVLALAGSSWRPAQLDGPRRAQLEAAFAQARVVWHGVEQQAIDAKAYALPAAAEAQLHRAVSDESAALSQLSDALRSDDPGRLLKAAAALKPPFARAFTAFGRPE